MSTPTQPKPVYLNAGGRPVFGYFHPSRPEPPSGVAVLICPPFGWEEVCSYRSRRAWAIELADAEHPTLRIDLDGTGDSGGSARDHDLVNAWVATITEAARWLRAASGCESVTGIGIGLGGLIATRAAAEGAMLDDLVLWGVPARGRTLTREMRAFALLNPSSSSDPADDPDPPLPEGYIETGGFILTPETTKALASIDLTKLEMPPAGKRRVLMLERDGIEVDPRLHRHLEQAGWAVTVAPGEGYGAMMDHPQRSLPPRDVFAFVEDWLSGARVPPQSNGTRELDTPASAEMSVGGVRIRETPITIEQPFGSQFGILAEPLDGPRVETTVVLLNAGALRRVGPGRMWVEIARRWAARGVPSLRLDIEAIGDSDGGEAVYDKSKALNDLTLVDQVITAIDALEALGYPGRFILSGLCSGTFWTFHAALRDERVTSAFLVNARVLYWDDSLETTREAQKSSKLLTGALWRRFVKGDISWRRVVEFARAAFVTSMRYPIGLARRRSWRRRVDAAFDRLRDGNRRIVFIFGESEPLLDELEREGQLAQLARWPNIEIERVPGRHHSLEPISAQKRMHDALDRALETELGRLKS